MNLKVLSSTIDLTRHVRLNNGLNAIKNIRLNRFRTNTYLYFNNTTNLNRRSNRLVNASFIRLISLTRRTLSVHRAGTTMRTFERLTIVNIRNNLKRTVHTRLFRHKSRSRQRFRFVIIKRITNTSRISINLRRLTRTTFLQALTAPRLLGLPTLRQRHRHAQILSRVPTRQRNRVRVRTRALFGQDIKFVASLLRATRRMGLLTNLTLFRREDTNFRHSHLGTSRTIRLGGLAGHVSGALLRGAFKKRPLQRS